MFEICFVFTFGLRMTLELDLGLGLELRVDKVVKWVEVILWLRLELKLGLD